MISNPNGQILARSGKPTAKVKTANSSSFKGLPRVALSVYKAIQMKQNAVVRVHIRRHRHLMDENTG